MQTTVLIVLMMVASFILINPLVSATEPAKMVAVEQTQTDNQGNDASDEETEDEEEEDEESN